MKTVELLPIIYDNFDVFHTMCLSSSLMSTYNCKEFDEDAQKILTFIGKAFKLPQKTTKDFIKCILGDMMNISLISDYHAVSSTEFLSDTDKENVELYEIKGRILEEIANCEAQNYNISDIRISNQIRATMKYDHFHHPYNSKLRFWQLSRLSKNGNIAITRQIAILYTLGVGCEENFKKAEEYFLKCILWGDKISAIMISELYRLYQKAQDANAEFYKMYFTDEPDFKNNSVIEYWNIAKLLSTYIISPKKDFLINHELAHLLISDKLSYDKKVDLILNFNEKSWKNIYFLTKKNKNFIGFRVNENE